MLPLPIKFGGNEPLWTVPALDRFQAFEMNDAFKRCSVVRKFFKPAGVIICGRQRARGPGSDRRGPSARKHKASSSPPESVTGISCAVNMLSENRIS
ncbi:hypothetical protein BA011_34300 (plasmid) [Rhizobium leguminosarum]|uniref:Uncharacterized protein n=1 Tax=Rhizobium leguminosarum TaxID=384 RepID=A0A1B1CMR9_RHILE|nr:hypothetical protein BA011_34300 [Rhizobium leguminosarum]